MCSRFSAGLAETTESIERHVEVIESLATSVPPLTDAVNRLNEQMAALVRLAAPLATAEHAVDTAERDISHVGRLFGRHRHEGDPPSPTASAQ
jgi:hypothetical protein